MQKGTGRLKDKVYKYCEKEGLISPGMKIVVGVSGGADSVCLLRILNEMKEALDLTLICVHIEHGIRGEESRRDRDFVRNLCGKLNIELKIYEEDVPRIARETSTTLEEAGRLVRYKAFAGELEDNKADVIAVAHHKGDQAETVIFNLIRGSGLKGISGMAPRRDKIIRPLLNVSRQEIEDYLKEIGQDYRIDSTNEDEGYTRNAIRNRIIPSLEAVGTMAVDHIIQAADELREADAYLRDQAGTAYDRAVTLSGSLYRVSIDELAANAPVIRRYVLRSLLTDLYSSHKDLEALHVKSLLGLCDKQSGRFLDLPRGMAAKREGDFLLVGRKEDILPSRQGIDIELNTAGDTPVEGRGTFSVSLEDCDGNEQIPDSHYTKWFDYDKIIGSVRIRNRLSGDYLTIGRDEDRKKLKKYLIDEKVPASGRDDLLLLADGDHIIWVVGMRISEHYKISRNTKHILKITYKENANGR